MPGPLQAIFRGPPPEAGRRPRNKSRSPAAVLGPIRWSYRSLPIISASGPPFSGYLLSVLTIPGSTAAGNDLANDHIMPRPAH
jgi:hypothetical protein